MLTRFSLPLVLIGVAFSLGAAEAAPNEDAPPAQAATQIPFGFTLGDAQQPTTSHVAKLGSDIAFPPGTFDGALGGLSNTVPITGKLNIPPTDGYFVAFRFMGTTGRVEIVPDGDATGTATVKTGKDTNCKTTQTNICADTDVTAKVFIKLSNVKVDGKALDVGPDCRTAQPAAVNIKALVPISLPAPPVKVTSTFTTPAFAGCTGREDLSRLLTGLVSGPGNTFVSNLTLRCFSSGCKQA
ncbi:hypothetical protein [Amycolatopsis sp. SID8362]|uniref:hypothetical protein n=1 Tax=Amycolatopsis sp. SID8362 TaxID=2690346 RepID=UPI00136B2015|nr:hypothetical protein [Amycolatopsis sp. SID8362]NBH02110.1 hypothetical protein [Amycolatopsis sp. SID8362]NED38813.1 hypothetical protein [Amycolatopsis sp. SID8362]